MHTAEAAAAPAAAPTAAPAAPGTFWQFFSKCSDPSSSDPSINKPFSRGGVGVEVLEVFWEELWLHFFWPTFWLHCILYRTYTGGEALPISKIQNTMYCLEQLD